MGPLVAKALVEGGAFMASLTVADLRYNKLDAASKQLLLDAVKGKSGFQLRL